MTSVHVQCTHTFPFNNSSDLHQNYPQKSILRLMDKEKSIFNAHKYFIKLSEPVVLILLDALRLTNFFLNFQNSFILPERL